MEALGIYCLKAGLILILFLGIYYFCLQKETFYRFNRFFLLTGIVTALLLPFISIRYTVEISTSGIPVNLITDSDPVLFAAENNTVKISLLSLLYKWLPVIYLTGICIFLIVRLAGLSHLVGFIRKSSYQKFSRYRLIESSDFKGAFSFFHFIFMPAYLNEMEKKLIIKHEETHIVQKHWVDLLLLNLLSIIWWFNPIIWLYGKMIRNNHEYLADQAVVTNYEQISYQKILVNQWFKTPVFPMTHSFSYSNQLKRIHMMKKNNSSPAKKHLSLLILPALAIFLWVFAEPEHVYAEKSTDNLFMQKTPVFITDILLPDMEPIVDKTDATHLQDKFAIENNHSSESFPKKDNTSEERQYVIRFAHGAATINGTKGPPMIIIDGKKTDKETEDVDSETIISVSTLVNEYAIKKYGQEAENGVFEIITTNYNKAGLTAMTTPDNHIKVVDHSKADQMKSKDLEIKENPLIIVDGERYDKGLDQIKPENIISISVLKSKPAVDQYGEDGKNGVILITTRKERIKLLETSGYEIQGTVVNKAGEPLENVLVATEFGEKILTDKQGNFTMRIAPDDWLTIDAEGYSTSKIETGKHKFQTTFLITLDKESSNVNN